MRPGAESCRPVRGPSAIWHPVTVMDISNSFEGDEPLTIIGISFDDVYRSQEFLTAMKRMSANGELRLKDAVIVAKKDDGTTVVHETVDLQAGRTALSGAMWTGLLGLLVGGPVGWLAGMGIGAASGAITAKVVDLGVPDEWVEWFRAAVAPDTFTVVDTRRGRRRRGAHRRSDAVQGPSRARQHGARRDPPPRARPRRRDATTRPHSPATTGLHPPRLRSLWSPSSASGARET